MRTVAALCHELTVDRRPDGELLAAFISQSSEEAFAELLRRHGPLVWGACRRLLPNPADAEDAFQAAFLVLVRRARRLTRSGALGPWLHRVAVWTARNVRRKNARRFARQVALPEHVTDPAAPPDPDLKADLDSALLALPPRYRDSIILCHLQGFSRREAAERLGCAEGTLSSWLHRGLAKLRDQLRGFDPTKALGVAGAAPGVLAANTARAAVATAIAGATVSPAVTSLVEGVIHMFWVKKATAASLALLAVFSLGVGIGVGTRTDFAGAGASEGVGEEKVAPAAQPKVTPPRDFPKEIAQLEAEIKAEELKHQLATEGAGEARKRLEAMKETMPKDATTRTDYLDAVAVLTRFELNATLAATNVIRLKDQLAGLKAANLMAEAPAKPEPPKAPPALHDLFGNTKELDAQLVAAERKVDRLIHAYDHTARAIDLLEKSGGQPSEENREALKKAEEEADAARKQLESLRHRFAAAKAANLPPLKATGPCIEVVVLGEEVCRVREYGRDGQFTTSAIAEGNTTLELLMRRALKDATGPRELWLTVSPNQNLFAIIHAVDACKQAGFGKVKLNGTLTPGCDLTIGQKKQREFAGDGFGTGELLMALWAKALGN